MEKDNKIKELEARIACIQKELKELKEKPEFLVGEWYSDDDGYLVNYQLGRKCYGFDRDGWVMCNNWCYNKESLLKDGFKLATPEEIQERLIKEAISRGYTKGVKVSNLGDITSTDICTDNFYFSSTTNRLFGEKQGEGGACIFSKGVWAKIISNPIMIGNYEVKKVNGGYEIGCKYIARVELTMIHNFLHKNGINSITIEEIKISLDTIREILSMKK